MDWDGVRSYELDGRVSDAREMADHRSHMTLDERRMVLTVRLIDEEGLERTVELPAEFKTCHTCRGRGKYVNPAIDAGGLSAEDMADPDFRHDYMTGLYDITCATCGGKRVVPEVRRNQLSKEQQEALRELDQAKRRDAEIRQIERAERMMGA
jgi:hypothetical protein